MRTTRVTTRGPTGRPSSRGGPGPGAMNSGRDGRAERGGGEAGHRTQDDADPHGQVLLDLDGPAASDARAPPPPPTRPARVPADGSSRRGRRR